MTDELLVLKPNGDILIRGEVIANDVEVVESVGTHSLSPHSKCHAQFHAELMAICERAESFGAYTVGLFVEKIARKYEPDSP